jgi:hypothetical protein
LAREKPPGRAPPAGDIDTVVMGGLKALDLERPIREADIRSEIPVSGFTFGGDYRKAAKTKVWTNVDMTWLY